MTLTKLWTWLNIVFPDAIILDLELHEGGGNGLFFLSKLHDLGLEKTALYPDHNAKTPAM